MPVTRALWYIKHSWKHVLHSSTCNRPGSFLNLVFPERVFAAYMSPLAQKHPKAALSIASLAGFILGLFKLITFPVLCATGLFIFPIKGLISCLFRKSFDTCSGYILATFLSLFSLALIIVGIVSCVTWAPGFIFPMISISMALATTETCFQIYTHLFPALEHKPAPPLKSKSPQQSSLALHLLLILIVLLCSRNLFPLSNLPPIKNVNECF